MRREYLSYINGEVLTGRTTWKAALWITAGMAAGIAVAAFFVFPPDILTTADRRVDWVGAALVTVGLVLLQFTVSSGESAPQGWKTPCEYTPPQSKFGTDWIDIIALLPVGVILVAAFFFWERHVINNTSRPPLMRLALWTRARGKLAAVYMIGFVSWMGFVVSSLMLSIGHTLTYSLWHTTQRCSTSRSRCSDLSEPCCGSCQCRYPE